MSSNAIRFQRIIARTDEHPDYYLDEDGNDIRRERDPAVRWDDMMDRQGRDTWGN